ncbi:MAG: growth inhibitor PemK [Sphingobacteriaceae bacterium]|nr:growth inhibitor PemK [Sphingobacteriaceae bacterium]
MELRQYQIILVNLDLTVGSEIKKTRPCVIISPDEMNKYLRTVVVAPMATTSKSYPTRVEIRHNDTPYWIVLDQVRTVDRSMVVKILGRLKEYEMSAVKKVINETYVA